MSEPVLEGWFETDTDEPHLLGSQCTSCGTIYFPKLKGDYCRNPECDGEEFNEIPLSRTGKLWSYTNAVYKPPEPFVAAEPFEPYAIAAVELDKEKMIVLGAAKNGVSVDQLEVGQDMELILEPLEDGKTTWKWAPV